MTIAKLKRVANHNNETRFHHSCLEEELEHQHSLLVA
jgi:hypothetical protein